MGLSKRILVTTSVTCFVLIMTTVPFLDASFARDLKSPHGTKPASQLAASPALVKRSSAKKSEVVRCVKTDSFGHTPPPIATPSVNLARVDRTFTLNTNCGQIVFKALGIKAPLTVIAMTSLARAGYFDHSLCHRITTAGIYVLQCGDPTARGTGGPMTPDGARWGPPDENLPANTTNNYPVGTIAMANSGISNSNGSQFFVVYKDTTLGNTYSIWGIVIKGLDIVKRIAAAGVVGGGTDGTPKQTIAIESVSVK